MRVGKEKVEVDGLNASWSVKCTLVETPGFLKLLKLDTLPWPHSSINKYTIAKIAGLKIVIIGFSEMRVSFMLRQLLMPSYKSQYSPAEEIYYPLE